MAAAKSIEYHRGLTIVEVFGMAAEVLMIIAGFVAGEELEGSRQVFPLASVDMPLTIGRGPNCSVTIGSAEDGGKGISMVHATIDRFADGSVVLRDGNGKASTNGIWHDGERIDRIDLMEGDSIALDNPVILSLFGRSEVRLWLETAGKLSNSPLDTSSGHELLGGVQKQSEHLAQQIWTMGEQLQGFAEQLSIRKALDADQQAREQKQEQSIANLSSTVKRSISVGILSLAIAILSNGLFNAMSTEKQKSLIEWAETIVLPLVLASTGWQLQRSKDSDPL